MADPTVHGIESRHAWIRLFASLALMTIGGVGMYGSAVVLPAIQGDFAVARGDASLPYTLTLMGFGVGGFVMGRLADRFGVMVVVLVGALFLGVGFAAAGMAGNLWQFNLAHGLLIGLLGTAASFAPLVADTVQWFDRRRGIALAICMSGNYLAGVVWPPLMQHFIDSVGWRTTYVGLGVACVLTMVPLALVLRPRRRRPLPRGRCRRRCVRRGSSASPIRRVRWACIPTCCNCCCAWPAWHVAWRWRCPRCISSRIAPTWASAPRGVPRCCR